MDPNFTERLTPGPAPRARDTWYYARDLDDDLQDLNIPVGVKAEVFANVYEYTRCVIPHYTNWERYLAFMRLIVLAVVSEFNGTIVDVLASDNLLGYSVPGLLDILFQGSPTRKDMEREFRTCILFTAEKASSRRNGELFRRYANCLADSPRQWVRIRDSDGLARFTVMAALACNDILDVCFSEEQLDIFGEIGITMYDAVAFYKHRSEGEVCSTFAYAPDDMRVAAFRKCREVLWALDAAWAGRPGMLIVPNVLRIFGGTIHMMMRRYRFVDENLRIGIPETEEVVSLTRANFKLWYRVDADKTKEVSKESFQHYKDVLAASEDVLFGGLAQTLETAGDGNCDNCVHRTSYGAEDTHRFGGVKLCDDCRATWRHFLESFPDRAAKAFPELGVMYARGIPSTSKF
ncbi:ABA 3 protein [Mycena galopus ATCC 62051]|nr:ABA 3 protein [Mycena galopus ATCC 62051]